MPIYEYHCDDCQNSFEIFVRSVNAPVDATCPQCNGKHVEKAVSAVSALGATSDSFSSSAASCAPSG